MPRSAVRRPIGRRPGLSAGEGQRALTPKEPTLAPLASTLIPPPREAIGLAADTGGAASLAADASVNEAGPRSDGHGGDSIHEASAGAAQGERLAPGPAIPCPPSPSALEVPRPEEAALGPAVCHGCGAELDPGCPCLNTQCDIQPRQGANPGLRTGCGETLNVAPGPAAPPTP
eukprot:10302984-Alexandrium_andersonii.AAC.1